MSVALKDKETACACSYSEAELWAIVPDIYGNKYPYPLKGQKFCPECGRKIAGKDRGATNE